MAVRLERAFVLKDLEFPKRAKNRFFNARILEQVSMKLKANQYMASLVPICLACMFFIKILCYRGQVSLLHVCTPSAIAHPLARWRAHCVAKQIDYTRVGCIFGREKRTGARECGSEEKGGRLLQIKIKMANIDDVDQVKYR